MLGSQWSDKMTDGPVHGGISLAELRAFGLDRNGVIDFSVNINPVGPPPSVKEALQSLDISAYPDQESLALREALSRDTGASLEQIIVGNGSTELIHLLARLILGESDRVAILAPTFGEYEVAVKREGAKIISMRAEEEKGFAWDISGLCKDIRLWEPKVVFVCNPNNPTGVYLSREEVEDLIRATGHGLMILDEAYVAFVQDAWDARSMLNRGNVVILRSMTKDYALAGLRLGYALCHKKMAKKIFAHQPSWSVNAAAQMAGVAALSDDTYLRRSKNCVEASRQYLRCELQALGYAVMPTAANFFMVKVGNATLFRQELLTKGICVRDCSSFGLPSFVRIGVRSASECEQLVDAVKKAVSQNNGRYEDSSSFANST
jgi:histidinol-phosphate aminotransferase